MIKLKKNLKHSNLSITYNRVHKDILEIEKLFTEFKSSYRNTFILKLNGCGSNMKDEILISRIRKIAFISAVNLTFNKSAMNEREASDYYKEYATYRNLLHQQSRLTKSAIKDSQRLINF